MAFGKTCPDCGANLDPGERCDCRGSGMVIPCGQRIDARMSREKEREAAKKKLGELVGRVTWRLVARPDVGHTIIEADVDKEPAFRFAASYDPQRGVWHLRPMKALNFDYRALYLVKRVYIDDVRDARPDR